MKGVINKGVQEFVEESCGLEKWDEIRRAAGCNETSFAISLGYPDQLTIDLVVSTANSLGLSPDATMMEFGKYWVANTGKRSYPTLYALAGKNARDFFRSVNRIHQQVTMSVSGTHPPSVWSQDLPDGGLAIHYVSERKLCPIVHGLILGVGHYFEETLAVEEVCCTRTGAPECIYEVRFP